jgi:hypothetical protein
MLRPAIAGVLLGLALLLAACGGTKDDAVQRTATPPLTTTDSPAATGAAGTASPAASATVVLNRGSCAEIRRTLFQSEAEKDWYIANCTNAFSQPVQLGPDPGPNVVPDSSFEAGAGSWTLVRPGVSPGPALLDDRISHTGVSSARLDNTFGGTCQVVCAYRSAPINVPDTPSREYRFGAWFLGSESIIDKTGARVELMVQGPDGSFQHLNEATGTAGRGWTYATMVGRVPPEYTTIVLDVSWRQNPSFPDVTGSLWIDDAFFGVASGPQTPDACREPSPGDTLTVHLITPAPPEALPAGGALVSFDFEYTLEAYERANILIEATSSADYPRWTVFQPPLQVRKGSGVETLKRSITVPSSGWVDIQVTMYAASPCGSTILARIGPIRYGVAAQ